MGEVTALYRYPVKGLSAEPTASLELRAGEGVPFDREFALALASTTFDEAAPEPLAKTYFLMLMRNEQLAALSTKFDAGSETLTISKGGTTLLEASVTQPAGRAAIADFFALYLGIDRPRLVRAEGHKFTDVSVVSPTMMRAVSVINLASVRALEQALGRMLDPLRFRANIYFDGLPAWSELEWADKEVSIGPVRMRGTLRTKRCAATNVNPATALRDENLPAALVRNFGHPDMGIYLDVLSKGLILAGSAAGVAAAFNTPLAGVVFAIEEMSRSFERSISSLVLIAVILAGIAAVSVTGTNSYFGQTEAILNGWKDWFVVPVAAVVGGVAGGVFSRIVIWGARKMPLLFDGFVRRRPIVFAALCGLVVAVLGIASNGASYGTGYGAAEAALNGHLAHPWIFTMTKFITTLVSQMSGIPGGILSPSLSIGAGLGGALAHLMPSSSPGAVAVLAMVGFFTGAVQAPITGFVIVAEMTGDQAMIIPLMATALLATGISKLITPEPLYHALAEDFRKRVEGERQLKLELPDQTTS